MGQWHEHKGVRVFIYERNEEDRRRDRWFAIALVSATLLAIGLGVLHYLLTAQGG